MKNFKSNKNRQETILLNSSIPFAKFTVIDENNQNLGLMNRQDALDLAESKNLDLFCVRENKGEELCKIIDYGKFKFTQRKKNKKKSSKIVSGETKEMRITPRIGERDLKIKINKISNFIQAGKKVKISMRLRGREFFVPNYGKDKLELVIEELKEVAELALPPKLFNRTYNMTIAPLRKKSQNNNEKNQDENTKISLQKTEKNGEEQVNSPKS